MASTMEMHIDLDESKIGAFILSEEDRVEAFNAQLDGTSFAIGSQKVTVNDPNKCVEKKPWECAQTEECSFVAGKCRPLPDDVDTDNSYQVSKSIYLPLYRSVTPHPRIVKFLQEYKNANEPLVVVEPTTKETSLSKHMKRSSRSSQRTISRGRKTGSGQKTGSGRKTATPSRGRKTATPSRGRKTATPSRGRGASTSRGRGASTSRSRSSRTRSRPRSK